MKKSQNVISYRARAYSDTEYVVEEYVLYLQDELAYQRHVRNLWEDSPWHLRRHVSAEILREYATSRFRSRVWNREGFQAHVEELCRKHGYERPVTHSLVRLNFFLATHFFCGKDTEPSDDLHALNELTYRYIQRYNTEAYLFMLGRAFPGWKAEDSEYFVDDQDLMETMTRWLLSVGYINGYEYERSYASGGSIVQFLEDMGRWDNQAVTSDNVAMSVRDLLKDAMAQVNLVDSTGGNMRVYASNLLKDKISRIECLNVGQANCSLGFGDADNQNPLAIFDLGTRPKNPAFVKKKLGKATKKGVVVISHYDEDHINGVKYLNDEAADRVWIIPQKRLNPTDAEGKLRDFINQDYCLELDDIDYDCKPFDPDEHIEDIGNIEIYRGNCKKKDPNQSTDENARGLICVVTKDKSMLLPGDCLYQEFPQKFAVDYMAVPHHSCCYRTEISKLATGVIKELIVFAGPHRGYKHPDMTQISKLQSANCKVVYLMKDKDCYFKDKEEIQCPPITITSKSHIVNL